jgi:hypothetical protein
MKPCDKVVLRIILKGVLKCQEVVMEIM